MQIRCGTPAPTVVGYSNINIPNRKEMRGVNFYAVSGEGIDIQDIVPRDTEGNIPNDSFKTWWWNPNLDQEGYPIGKETAIRLGYYWDPEDERAQEGWVVLDEMGTHPELWVWVTDDSMYPTKWNKKFQTGAGFYTQPTVSGYLTVSGQVLQPVENAAYYPMQLAKGKSLVCNPFPVEVDLQDIVPFDGENIAQDSFKTWWWNPNLDEEGYPIGNETAIRLGYYWDPEDERAQEGWVVLDEMGTHPELWVWVTNDPTTPTKWNKTFAVAEGFYTQPTVTNPILKFPNPFYKGDK